MTLEQYGAALTEAGILWDTYEVGPEVVTFFLAGVVVARVVATGFEPTQ